MRTGTPERVQPVAIEPRAEGPTIEPMIPPSDKDDEDPAPGDLTGRYNHHSKGVSKLISDEVMRPEHRSESTFATSQYDVVTHGSGGALDTAFHEPRRVLPAPDIVVVYPRVQARHRAFRKGFVRLLRAMAVQKIVYVSDDPKAQVANIGMLTNLGYRVDKLETFDSRPHDMGMTTVVLLSLVHHPFVAAATPPPLKMIGGSPVQVQGDDPKRERLAHG